MRGLIVFHDRVRRCASSRFRTALELSRSCDLTLLGAAGAQLISSKQLGAVRPERSAAAGCGDGAWVYSIIAHYYERMSTHPAICIFRLHVDCQTTYFHAKIISITMHFYVYTSCSPER